MSTRICPACGEPIEVPDDEDMPDNAVVRHPIGMCPTAPREEKYRYTGTYVVHRYEIGDDELDENFNPLSDGAPPGEVLARVSHTMDARTFADVADELALRVGTKISDVIKSAPIIDR